MDLKISIEHEDFINELKEEKRKLIPRVIYVAHLIAKEVVNYARDTGGYGTQPPAKPGEGPRQAHPGGWADITSNLANSIEGHVEADGLTIKAVVQATMEYAEELDAKTGYDVLGGAEKIVRKAIKKHQHKLFEDFDEVI